MPQETGLNIGLKESYVGKEKPGKATRRIFPINVYHFENYTPGKTIIYHDEYISGSQLGAGQEIVEINNERFTRTYLGGVSAPSTLKRLSITPGEIYSFLKETIVEKIEETRLKENCYLQKDNWQYYYKIIANDIDPPTTCAKETIKYKDKIVFVHWVTLCQIK